MQIFCCGMITLIALLLVNNAKICEVKKLFIGSIIIILFITLIVCRSNETEDNNVGKEKTKTIEEIFSSFSSKEVFKLEATLPRNNNLYYDIVMIRESNGVFRIESEGISSIEKFTTDINTACDIAQDLLITAAAKNIKFDIQGTKIELDTLRQLYSRGVKKDEQSR